MDIKGIRNAPNTRRERLVSRRIDYRENGIHPPRLRLIADEIADDSIKVFDTALSMLEQSQPFLFVGLFDFMIGMRLVKFGIDVGLANADGKINELEQALMDDVLPGDTQQLADLTRQLNRASQYGQLFKKDPSGRKLVQTLARQTRNDFIGDRAQMVRGTDAQHLDGRFVTDGAFHAYQLYDVLYPLAGE